MIRNSVINLSNNSANRLDALNTIRYTLLLDYTPPKYCLDSSYIDTLFDACNKCCKNLFSDSSGTLQLNFFGMPPVGSKTPLSHFNWYMLNPDSTPGPHIPGILDLILQDCIISSYHALITELMCNNSITSYELANKIKEKGISSLYKSGKLKVSKSGIIFNSKIHGATNKHSSVASDFKKKTSSHQRLLPDLFFTLVLPIKTIDKENYRYSLQFSNLSYTLFNTPVSQFHTSELSIKKCIEQMEKNTNLFLPSFSIQELPIKSFRQYGGEPVDGIYYYYLTERIFNLRLTYSLLKHIVDLEMKTNYRFSQKETLDILSSCKKLPNVFSRQYFIKYAFDAFIEKPDSYLDFWHHQSLDRSGAMFTSTRRFPKGFQFAKWLEQYQLFVNYMADFIIPVYQWCFMNMLLESIEYAEPHKTHFEHIEQALSCLASYLNERYTSIFEPIQLESNMDQVTINRKIKNWVILENLSKDVLNYIRNQMFLSADSVELNLPLINPQFFKEGNKDYAESNINRIRKFYIDLIRYSRLEKPDPK